MRGFAQDTLVGDALRRLAAEAGVEPRWAATIDKKLPVAAGLGGGSSDAATALRLANATLPEPLPHERLHALAAALGADVPFFLAQGPQLGTGDGGELAPLELPQDYWVVLLLPEGAGKASTGAVYDAFDARGGEEGFDARREALISALAGARRARDLAALPAQRPRLVAARRRARGARRLPRRRHGSRAGRLRALPPPRGRRGRPAGPSGPRTYLADGSRLVRLSR